LKGSSAKETSKLRKPTFHGCPVEYIVAMVRRLPEFRGLFRKKAVFLWGSFEKETSKLREQTLRCYPVKYVVVMMGRISEYPGLFGERAVVL